MPQNAEDLVTADLTQIFKSTQIYADIIDLLHSGAKSPLSPFRKGEENSHGRNSHGSPLFVCYLSQKELSIKYCILYHTKNSLSMLWLFCQKIMFIRPQCKNNEKIEPRRRIKIACCGLMVHSNFYREARPILFIFDARARVFLVLFCRHKRELN